MTTSRPIGDPTTSVGCERSRTSYLAVLGGLIATLTRGLRVLDLGCAGRFMAEALILKGARVTGINPAAQAIEAARARAKSIGQPIRYDVGVGKDLPYEALRYDAVDCVDVLEHVSDLEKVLSEVARVLKPGGAFLYDTINRNPVSRFATKTVAENIRQLLPKSTHDPELITFRTS